MNAIFPGRACVLTLWRSRSLGRVRDDDRVCRNLVISRSNDFAFRVVEFLSRVLDGHEFRRLTERVPHDTEPVVLAELLRLEPIVCSSTTYRAVHHKCDVEMCPLRTDFSRDASALMA